MNHTSSIGVNQGIGRLVMGGYVIVVMAALGVLFATGAWSIAIFASLALVLFIAADGVRATAVLFLCMPMLSELLPAAYKSLWYLALYPMAGAWLKAVVGQPQRIHGRFALLYGAFVFSMLLSMHFGADWRIYLPPSWAPEAKWRILEPICSSLPALLISGAIATRRDVRRLGWWIVAVGLVHCILAFTINLPDPNWTDLGGRNEGLFLGSVHVMGLFGTLYLVVAVAMLLNERGLQRRLLAGCVVAFIIMVAMSGSRTSIFALVVVSAMAAVVHRPRHRLNVVPLYIAAAVIITVIGIAASVTRLTGIWANFAAGRGALIQMGLELFARYPITGAGIGLHVPMLADHPVPWGFGLNFIHTYYVTILAELGVIGFTLYLLILAMFVRNFRLALTRLKAADDLEMYRLTFALFLSFITALMMLSTQADTADRLFWGLGGIALVMRRLASGELSERGQDVRGGTAPAAAGKA